MGLGTSVHLRDLALMDLALNTEQAQLIRHSLSKYTPSGKA